MSKLNDIVVLVAESGSGKDTLAQKISEWGYNFIVSTTTRPMREGESRFNPYLFKSKEEFIKLINEDAFVEYRTYDTLLKGEKDTWYYGVEKTQIEDDEPYVVVLDIQGLIDFNKVYGDRIISFYIYVDEDTRKERAMGRGGFDESEWNRRIEDDKIVFNKEVIFNSVDYTVKNYSLNDAISFIGKFVG